MKNLLGEKIPNTPKEIINHCPLRPAKKTALIAFSGGNDSRAMAHVLKLLELPYKLQLAAIDTKLGMDGWKQSILDFAAWIDLPVLFWTGEGRSYYGAYVETHGWPGNAEHSKVQNRLKGRAYRKMMYAHRTGTEGEMKARGEAVWVLSGIRKYESQKRMLLKSPYSYREGIQFINPLFYWTNADVDDYLAKHSIPKSPGTQWDCKCGCTVKNAVYEWGDIEKCSPHLLKYLTSLQAPCPWNWGEFDPSAHKAQAQMQSGQLSWLDDGSIESYPTCINCIRDLT